jgi:predicted permease
MVTRLLTIVNRLRALVGGRRRDRDLDEEMAFHVAMKVREYVSAGMPEHEARVAARRAFGNLTLAVEDSRAAWRFAFLESILQDVRYGTRALRRTPVFTVAVVLTLALGIGANTAIFTLLDRVLLRSLPVDNPDALVALGSRSEAGTRQSDGPPERDTTLFSYPLYRDFRQHTDVFSDLAAVSSFPVTVYLGPGTPAHGRQLEQAEALVVSGNLFELLGVTMPVGRALTPDDNLTAGGHPVVVLSHRFWTSRFGQDRKVLGRTIHANGTPYTIIGVAGPGLRGLSPGYDTDLWIPMAMQPQLMREASYLDDRNTMWLRLIARLRPGVTREQALARTNDLFRRLVTEEAGRDVTPGTRAAIARLATDLMSFAGGFSHLRERWEKPLLVLMTIVGLVLLIACANVGNLLLARAASRRRELSVRLALGSGRRRLIRQLLTESLMLAAIGGVLALVVARGTVQFLLGFLSARGADMIDTSLDSRVLLFTAGVTALAAFLFGLIPAVRATQAQIHLALRDHSATSAADSHGWKLRRMLVVFQVAVSMCLLVGAGLLLRSLGNLRSQDMGFRADGVLLVEIDPQGGGIPEKQLPNLHRELLDRIGALPDVSAASLSLYGLLGNSRRIHSVSVDGSAARPDEDTRAQTLWVTPRYFEVIGVPVVAGRGFDERDRDGAQRVAIVSESFARRFFGGRPAVGRRFGVDGPESSREIEIVGMVRDIKPTDLWEPPPPLFYRPAAQMPGYLNSIDVRTSRDPAIIAPQLRQVVADVAPNLPILDVTPLVTRIDASLRGERTLSQLTGVFGLVALLLASIGLHGVLAYGVARRTGEIGLRLALGAARRQVLWMVLGDALAWVGAGAVVGLLATLALGRLLSTLLFGLDPIDPITMVVAGATLVVVAVAAAYWPARRAARLDPLNALRCE